jgi:hypothetical protein
MATVCRRGPAAVRAPRLDCLARDARRNPGCELVAWWPARRCAQQWRIVRPDAYGHWRKGQREADWFLEVDRGTAWWPS